MGRSVEMVLDSCRQLSLHTAPCNFRPAHKVNVQVRNMQVEMLHLKVVKTIMSISFFLV